MAINKSVFGTMSQESTSELQQLKTMLDKQGVKYAIASFVDIHGMCKAKMVPLTHFDQMMQGQNCSREPL